MTDQVVLEESLSEQDARCQHQSCRRTSVVVFFRLTRLGLGETVGETGKFPRFLPGDFEKKHTKNQQNHLNFKVVYRQGGAAYIPSCAESGTGMFLYIV